MSCSYHVKGESVRASRSSLGAIIGGVIGGLALLLLSALLALCIYRRRRSKDRSEWQEDRPEISPYHDEAVVYAAAPSSSPMSPSTFGMAESRPMSTASYQPVATSSSPGFAQTETSIDSRPASGFFALPTGGKGNGDELDAPPAYDGNVGPTTSSL